MSDGADEICVGGCSNQSCTAPTHLAKISAVVERMEPKLSTVHRIITGDSEPERGHVIRIDRLERAEDRRNKWAMIVLGTVAALVINAAWDKLREAEGSPDSRTAQVDAGHRSP